jgi:hypothetical protein
MSECETELRGTLSVMSMEPVPERLTKDIYVIGMEGRPYFGPRIAEA